MTDRIVDITATGATLRDNDLVITGRIMDCTARFFVNPGAARLDPRVRNLADRLAAAVKDKHSSDWPRRNSASARGAPISGLRADWRRRPASRFSNTTSTDRGYRYEDHQACSR